MESKGGRIEPRGTPARRATEEEVWQPSLTYLELGIELRVQCHQYQSRNEVFLAVCGGRWC